MSTKKMINENKEINNAIIISDEFLEWEERDPAHITLLRHCIAGMWTISIKIWYTLEINSVLN